MSKRRRPFFVSIRRNLARRQHPSSCGNSECSFEKGERFIIKLAFPCLVPTVLLIGLYQYKLLPFGIWGTISQT